MRKTGYYLGNSIARMHSLINKNLITTKEAGMSCGYTPDYVAKLARSGKVKGQKIGHNWFVDKESLGSFLSARTKNEEREEENTRVSLEVGRPTKEEMGRFDPSPASENETGGSMFFSHTVAAGTAVAVVAVGAMIGGSTVLPRLAGQISSVAQEASVGFALAFEPAIIRTVNDARSYHVAARTQAVSALQEAAARAPESLPLLEIESRFFEEILVKEYSAPHPVAVDRAPSMETHSNALAALRGSAMAILATAQDPRNLAAAAGHAYLAFGSGIQKSTINIIDAYCALVNAAGVRALSAAITARDAIAGSTVKLAESGEGIASVSAQGI